MKFGEEIERRMRARDEKIAAFAREHDARPFACETFEGRYLAFVHRDVDAVRWRVTTFMRGGETDGEAWGHCYRETFAECVREVVRDGGQLDSAVFPDLLRRAS